MKRGRPPVPCARTERLQIRLTPLELTLLRAIARAMGLTPSAYVRARSLAPESPSHDPR